MVGELLSADPAAVGPYRLLGRLGAGGMGQVFLGQSPGGRLVAVKVIRPELAGEAGFRKRFAREVIAARNVSGLFTALVVDADPDAVVPWLATAYVAGPSLAEAVEEHGVLPAPSVAGLAAGLAEGLAAIHAAGVVHRDLKPSNVLLAHDGPRVIDFGISRAVETTMLTQSGTVIGSPGFLSPEQADGAPVGPPSDIFSLGAVLTFAAAGEGPFGSGPTPALIYRVVAREPNLARVPDELRGLIGRCMAKDPADRPTAAGLLAELGDGRLAGDWLPEPVTAALGRYTAPARDLPGAAAAVKTPTAAAGVVVSFMSGADTAGLNPAVLGAAAVGAAAPGAAAPSGAAAPGAPVPVAAAAGSGRPGGRVSRLWVAAAAAVVLVAAAGGTAFALSGSGTSGTAGAGQPQAKITLRQVAASSRPTPTASPSASARHTTAKPAPVTLAPAEAAPAEAAPASFAPATAAPVTAAPATSAPVKHTAAPVVHKTTPAPVTVTQVTTAPAPPPVTYTPPPLVPVTTTTKAQPPKPTSAVLPSVFGENLAGAEASLKAAGFTNYSWAYECYGSANITDVVSQTPAAGSTIALTAPVHINLQASNCATMPDVVGFQISNAVSILEGLGFTGPTITWRFSCYAGTVPINRVMTQSPAAGTSYGKNQLISLGVEANNCK